MGDFSIQVFTRIGCQLLPPRPIWRTRIWPQIGRCSSWTGLGSLPQPVEQPEGDDGKERNEGETEAHGERVTDVAIIRGKESGNPSTQPGQRVPRNLSDWDVGQVIANIAYYPANGPECSPHNVPLSQAETSLPPGIGKESGAAFLG
jgi:hypothetical protein